MQRDSSRFEHVMGLVGTVERPQQYLHWNDLRRRTPPMDLTHKEWWCLIKLHRLGQAKRAPFTDKSGNPFVFTDADPIPEHLHRIDQGGGGRIAVQSTLEPIMNEAAKDYYHVSSLFEEAITSSQLEGAVTTRREARRLLQEGRKPRNQHERMVVNNYSAMKRIGELRDELLTPEILFELHRIVTENTLEPSRAGALRENADKVYVTTPDGEPVHVPPPAAVLPARIGALCRFANADEPDFFVHPVIRSIILHFWLAYDHPFVDGNGRTARAVFYWSMLRQGYWLFEFLSISRVLLHSPTRYYKAFLHTETDGNDLTYFVLHQLGVIRQAVQELHDYIARKTSEMRELETQFRGMQSLNHRQQALIRHALRNPGAHYSVRGHQHSHNVVYETARQDLLVLEQLGLLRMTRAGRAMRFYAVENLESRLKETG